MEQYFTFKSPDKQLDFQSGLFQDAPIFDLTEKREQEPATSYNALSIPLLINEHRQNRIDFQSGIFQELFKVMNKNNNNRL
jgi:hypothetical protein